MSGTYQLRLGHRQIGLKEAPTAHVAVLDYVRSLGCRDDEIVRLGEGSLSWRGAVFTAVPVSSELHESRTPAEMSRRADGAPPATERS
jgi:hypothetical protein